VRALSTVVDVRAKPDATSERLSQLIFGEEAEILDEAGDFYLIRCSDGVTGYAKKTLLGDKDEPIYKLSRHYHAHSVNLSFGSYLTEEDAKEFRIPRSYLYPIEQRCKPEGLAPKFIGVPYLWGGTSSFGFDCSGFVQRLFRFCGKELPRNSDQQMSASEDVGGIRDAEKGDLLFFKGHVAIYVGRGKIIHANGHHGSVSRDWLFDGSPYSNYLLSILLKVGRFRCGQASLGQARLDGSPQSQ